MNIKFALNLLYFNPINCRSHLRKTENNRKTEKRDFRKRFHCRTHAKYSYFHFGSQLGSASPCVGTCR